MAISNETIEKHEQYICGIMLYLCFQAPRKFGGICRLDLCEILGILYDLQDHKVSLTFPRKEISTGHCSSCSHHHRHVFTVVASVGVLRVQVRPYLVRSFRGKKTCRVAAFANVISRPHGRLLSSFFHEPRHGFGNLYCFDLREKFIRIRVQGPLKKGS